jgi:hypothetical protein
MDIHDPYHVLQVGREENPHITQATEPFHKEVLGVARFDSVETESFTHISILLRADMRLHTRDHSQSQTTKVTEQIVRCPSGLLIDETERSKDDVTYQLTENPP